MTDHHLAPAFDPEDPMRSAQHRRAAAQLLKAELRRAYGLRAMETLHPADAAASSGQAWTWGLDP